MSNLFLTNYTSQSFLERILDNLRHCDSFDFSVSFIKTAGLVLLKNDIEAALARGCHGRIITSTYQNFTDIGSLRLFLALSRKYKNFECHLDFDSFHDEGYQTLGYHSKGYIFRIDNHVEIVVGSSNITRHALKKNVEWDLLISENCDSDVYLQTMQEFEDKWANTYPLDDELIKKYETRLNYAIERWDMDYDRAENVAKPNYMQRAALKQLNRYRAMGIGKALVVSAAGSGKTYLSAFDVLNFNPVRLLYIVHEGSILKKSLETFQIVFGPDKYCGIYNGESHELDADFLFSTNIMMSRNLELFDKHYFDYIIIDECHHGVADSYRKIIEYFEPEFLLGLTATPERADNKDAFELFDYNVPYELRLRDAIINDLVVPFHYYGIRDTLVNYGLNDKQERKMLAQIADTDHCKFIRDQIESHRPEGKLKALAFCKNITHAQQMSEALGEYYKTAYLTDKNTVGERLKAYNDLQSDTSDLEVLCSVNILNEGVDIPGVNMVLFLRPTQSSTIFIQQLGRGLRKYENKQFVTVLDFIGNSYRRSVQIALALGSLSKNLVLEKPLMKTLVKENFSALGLQQYGVSINIDSLSKEEIINYIDNENFNSLTYLRQDYENFKKYIKCESYPRHMDYINNDCAPDLIKFINIRIDGKKSACYYNFIRDADKDSSPFFSDEQIDLLKYASSLLPLVRPHEYLILKNLMGGKKTYAELYEAIKAQEDTCTNEQLQHALRYMLKKAPVNLSNSVYSIPVKMSEPFQEHLDDLITYGLTRYYAEYLNGEEFLLWHGYSMGKVQLKLLKDPDYNQKGTYYYGKRIIIFASLKKDASIEERLNYKDKYLTPDLFQWESEYGINESTLASLLNSDEALVFIRKVTEENGIVQPFIYTGRGKITNPRKCEKLDGNTKKPIITWLFDIAMEVPLPDDLQCDFGLAN